MTDLRARLQEALGTAYTLEREIGGGGMSRVFTARDKSLDRVVVVKLLPPELSAEISVERFRREIQLTASLRHPLIVPILSAGEMDGLPFYTMPFIEGESLRERIARTGELSIEEAIRLLRDVAEALESAHARNVVHRDIKPANIMLDAGHALVTDFGVAKAISSAAGERTELTSRGIAIGTPAYMAPEQGTADPHMDHRADIYAFGCVAYEMLTGHPPFSGLPPHAILAAHATEAPDLVSRRRPAVPRGLADLVMRCLSKRPADRPQQAADLIQALSALDTRTERQAPWITQSSRARFLGAAAVVAAMAIAGVFSSRRLWSGNSKAAAIPVAARSDSSRFIDTVEYDAPLAGNLTLDEIRAKALDSALATAVARRLGATTRINQASVRVSESGRESRSDVTQLTAGGFATGWRVLDDEIVEVAHEKLGRERFYWIRVEVDLSRARGAPDTAYLVAVQLNGEEFTAMSKGNPGDNLELRITPTRDSYLTIVAVTGDSATTFLPNPMTAPQENFVPADSTFTFPPRGGYLHVTASLLPGQQWNRESFIVIASRRPLALNLTTDTYAVRDLNRRLAQIPASEIAVAYARYTIRAARSASRPTP